MQICLAGILLVRQKSRGRVTAKPYRCANKTVMAFKSGHLLGLSILKMYVSNGNACMFSPPMPLCHFEVTHVVLFAVAPTGLWRRIPLQRA